MKNENIIAKRRQLSAIEGVRFESVTWTPSQADVDLSIVCMFEQEMPGTRLSGGLFELDEALGGALTKLRDEGCFRAQEMETLLVKTPLIEVRSPRILVIGLGNPLTFSSAVLERAIRVAVREAARLGVIRVAFAPNLLDAGLKDLVHHQVEAAIVRGAVSALQAEYRLNELGLASSPVIRNWAFDVGLAHFDAATEEFLKAFRSFVAL